MSTYQYYEFRAIDSPLTRNQREEVASLSSRAEVSSHQAIFSYLYGDFRGNEEELMETHFDVMLCVANWGTRRVMFRLPSSLIDINQLDSFSVSEEIAVWLSKDKKYTILDLNFDNEDMHGDWIEGEGLLNELIDLREELIQGDFRLLYLAWLKASEKALEMEDIDKDTLEPPVPSGLQQLSTAQKAYIKFVDIDKGMVAVASEQSDEQQNELIDVKEWIEMLSKEKRYEFLLRLSRDEKNLFKIFNKYLHEFATKGESQKIEENAKRRNISSLIKDAEIWYKQKRKEREKQEGIANKHRLELLAKNESKVWEKVYRLIEEMNSNSYDKAVKQLNELCELSEYKGEEKIFEEQVAKIHSRYPRRQALLRRMRSAGLTE